MFINKWLVIDSVSDMLDNDWKEGFCLDLSHESGGMSDLYLILQRLPVENPFAILLSDKTMTQKVDDSYFENILSLFFQPSYFLDFDMPVIFLTGKATNHAGFIEKLTGKCMKQGFPVLLFKTKDIGSVEEPTTHVYEVRSANVDPNTIVEKWLSQYLERKDPSEIHFLFAKDQPGLTGILQKMQDEELGLYNTQVYKYANLFYEKQKMYERYKKELDAMVSVEYDTRVYLTMQKKQTADNVEWYYNEYEILPTWYKQVGHIIKVLMGKRTFRSLFSDKVKKYKD